jgi:hypothetical protein
LKNNKVSATSRHNYFYRAYAVCSLLGAFATAAWRGRFYLPRQLALPEGVLLSARERSRLRHYYDGATYLSAMMNSLRGRRRSAGERFLFANLAALSCFFDDLADQHTYFADPDSFAAQADRRGIARHLSGRIEHILPADRQSFFRAYLLRVFQAEFNRPENPDPDTLRHLQAEKGGSSVLLFRSLLEEPCSKAEENAWFQFGALIQFSDDIFDLWHDRQRGHTTLALWYAERNMIAALAKAFEKQAYMTRHAFLQCPQPHQRICLTFGMQHILESITRVCLQHYLRLSYQYPQLPWHDRTSMVADMEKLSYRLKVVRQWLHPIQ